MHKGNCPAEEWKYYCLDPTASKRYTKCDADNFLLLGDGFCNYNTGRTFDGMSEYNNPDCNWDGGDCCASTCISGAHSCGTNKYKCLDPRALENLLDCDIANQYIGDGWCNWNDNGVDSFYASDGSGTPTGTVNTAKCNYDGGDCCQSTCIFGAISCGSNGFHCLDPNASKNVNVYRFSTSNYIIIALAVVLFIVCLIACRYRKLLKFSTSASHVVVAASNAPLNSETENILDGVHHHKYLNSPSIKSTASSGSWSMMMGRKRIAQVDDNSSRDQSMSSRSTGAITYSPELAKFSEVTIVIHIQ
jgi:hypothetical protein